MSEVAIDKLTGELLDARIDVEVMSLPVPPHPGYSSLTSLAAHVIDRMGAQGWRLMVEERNDQYHVTFDRRWPIRGSGKTLALAVCRAALAATEQTAGTERGHWECTDEMTTVPGSNRHWVCDDGRVFNAWSGRQENDYRPIGAVSAQQQEQETWQACRRKYGWYLQKLEIGAPMDDLNGEIHWERYRNLPREMAIRKLTEDIAYADGVLADLKAVIQ